MQEQQQARRIASAKLARLKRVVQDGRYVVDPERLADALLADKGARAVLLSRY